MKYHKINQASENTFDTKPRRNRHDPCETVTLLHRCEADGTAVFYGFKSTAPLFNRSHAFRHRILTHTLRCGFEGIPRVRFGSVLRNQESHGAVRGGFQIL